jgi:hypothetical protein
MENMLTMEKLEKCFKKAKESGAKYIGLSIYMEGFTTDEIIINSVYNLDKKLEYYKTAYNDDLTHKFSKGISISGYTFADSFEEIQFHLV